MSASHAAVLALILTVYLSPSILVLVIAGFKYFRETRAEREPEREPCEVRYFRGGWPRT